MLDRFGKGDALQPGRLLTTSIGCPIRCMATSSGFTETARCQPEGTDRVQARLARDFTNRRERGGGEIDEAERPKIRYKSNVRARVQHAFAVIKQLRGFTKADFTRCAIASWHVRQQHPLCAGVSLDQK